MGEIKDLTDLVGKLFENVKDRKAAAELRQVQSLTSGTMSEHAELHGSRIGLTEEKSEAERPCAGAYEARKRVNFALKLLK